MKKLQQFLPWVVFVIALLYAGQKIAFPESIESSYNLDKFRQLPVSDNGRTKPIDTVARNSLMNISGRQSLSTQDGKLSAIEWYLQVVTKSDGSLDHQVFRIDHPELLTLIGLETEQRTRFSFLEIEPSIDEVFRQATLASQTKAKARDPFQSAVLILAQRLQLFDELRFLQKPYLVAPSETVNEWQSFVKVYNEQPTDANMLSLLRVFQAYVSKDATAFNEQLASYDELVHDLLPYDVNKARYEVSFNQIQPFIVSAVLYLGAFLCGCFGLLSSQMTKPDWSRSLLRSMTSLIIVAFIVQTIGIISRVYLQGRPPVTNLYSSAVFIGWFCVIIGLFAERLMKNGLSGIMASVIGFGTLIIAHNLGSSGDTMEMMQAVLDSNFWLATHVVVVTIGYSATFFAGFLAIAYVLLGVFTPTLDRERGRSLIKMVYGVICFATITSFVGTVLGGIWADQSWGRFWGWDAKENGAALIVLWNLLILHARWGGMIRERGLVNLAIFGNIITAWSWFGTNMLGVGLHSYGFTQSAVFWIAVFVLSQLILISVGMLPMKIWRSKFAKL